MTIYKRLSSAALYSLFLCAQCVFAQDGAMSGQTRSADCSDPARAAVNSDAPLLESSWSKRVWKAQWCVCPVGSAPSDSLQMGLFRKKFSLPEKPEKFIINITADIRAELYINGKLILRLPEKGDIFNWYFDTIDIAPFLKKGDNVAAVKAWNFGENKMYCQMSNWSRPRFIIQAESAEGNILNTPSGWKAKRSQAYYPLRVPHIPYLGALEKIDAEKLSAGWLDVDFDDSLWTSPDVSRRAAAYGFDRTGEIYYGLVPRDIPFMEETSIYDLKVRSAENISSDGSFLKCGGEPLKVPANTKCSLLLDRGALVNAYLTFVSSGGRGAKMTVKYAESLCEKGSKDYRPKKGNRNEIEGKDFHAPSVISTEYLFDGRENVRFSTLDWRTYRYVNIDISTAGEPLEISDFHGVFTGYPFKQNASFESSDKSLDKIWEVSWRTARLCAFDTYMDCPYYERLQYIGDTRIQALISLYVSGDARLMRKALKIIASSRTGEGLLQSRYPTSSPQIIPPFCLYWVNMLRDYQLYVPDAGFVRSQISVVRDILTWFEDRIDPNTGMLSDNMAHWNFLDWSGWNVGNAPKGKGAGSATHTLHFALTLRDGARILRSFGFDSEARRYEALADKLCRATYKNCWNPSRKMLADFKDADKFSEHANIMAVLSGAVEPEQYAPLLRRVMASEDIAKATYYYRFYLTRALVKAGMGGEYLDTLKPWRDMLSIGLSTFAENPDPVRSDCHAWSASPVYEFLATVCGVESAADGFKKVRITPRLGRLEFVKALVPHPQGSIALDLKKSADGKLSGKITLPEGVGGILTANGAERNISGSVEF